MEVSSYLPPENDVISRCFPEFLAEADVETEFAINEEMMRLKVMSFRSRWLSVEDWIDPSHYEAKIRCFRALCFLD